MLLLPGLKHIKLLSATIITDEDYRYFISFKSHHPDFQMTEYVRLALRYYAKMLFIPDPANPNMTETAIFLLDAMQRVIEVGFTRDSNILRSADIYDVVDIVESPPLNFPRKIVANLYFLSATQRHLVTKLPLKFYMQQLAFSVFALLQSTLKKLDERDIRLLARALARMNEFYASGKDYTNIKMLAAVPNSAYIEAVMDGARRGPD